MAAAGMSVQAHAASSAARVVALDWPSAQNLLALGVTPMAIPELERYAMLVVEPSVPLSTLDLGLRSEPNLELVLELIPDLILMGDELAGVAERLEVIAPVFPFSPDAFDGGDTLLKGAAALLALAQRIGRERAYGLFRQRFDAQMVQAKARLHIYDGRPVFVVTIIDGRRVLLFGKNSLFQSVLDRLGVANAWDGPTTAYGHVTVTVDRLAEQKDARLLCVGDTSTVSLDKLLASPVIASLPFAREGRVARIPDVLFYGGLPSASRFLRLASAALAGG
jgi:iron complex transport system substrate-binding protein